MTKLQEKAQAQVKQTVGQIVGDDKLVAEGKEQAHNAGRASNPSDLGNSKGKEDDKDKGRHRASSVNKAASEQTSEAAGRKGPQAASSPGTSPAGAGGSTTGASVPTGTGDGAPDRQDRQVQKKV